MTKWSLATSKKLCKCRVFYCVIPISVCDSVVVITPLLLAVPNAMELSDKTEINILSSTTVNSPLTTFTYSPSHTRTLFSILYDPYLSHF